MARRSFAGWRCDMLGLSGEAAIRHRLPALALAALIALGSLASGCRWYAWEPTESQAALPPEPPDIPLAPGETLRQQLDCPAGHCQTRFRIEARQPGELQVEVRPTDPNPATSLSVVLEDPVGRVLDQQSLSGRVPPLRVSSAVQKGPHVALVRAIGGRVPFTISARFRAGGVASAPWVEPTAPPPAPARRTLPTGEGSQPGAVFDPRTNFHHFRKYAFAQEPRNQIQAGRSGSNPFEDQQIQRAVRAEMSERGFTQVPVSEADFLVSQHVGSRSTTWYSVRGLEHQDAYDRFFDMWRGRGGRVVPHTYTDKTVTLDFIAPKTGQLIWHGWTTEAAPQTTSDESRNLRTAVKNVLDKFPPK